MKYCIENSGQGLVMIRVYVPESLAASFLAFIDQKSRENPPVIKKSSSLQNENYFIQLNEKCAALFMQNVDSGLPMNSAVSETLKKIKALGFHNISYDGLKSILTKQGCFKTKKALLVR